MSCYQEMLDWAKSGRRLALLFACSGAASLATAGVAVAQYYDPCPYVNDGDCDEPNGLGYCAYGTDTADCSNPNSNYGSGIGFRAGSSVYNPNTPNTTNTGSYLHNPCPYLNDGDCDEPNGLGLCEWGTDVADCSNPNSNFGGGSGYGGGVGSGVTPQPLPGGTTTSGAIRILSATYGGNCGATSGNVTSYIAAQCNGQSSCSYRVDYTVIGDPAYGCQKDYQVSYDCGDGRARVASAAAEAGYGSIVSLQCSGG